MTDIIEKTNKIKGFFTSVTGVITSIVAVITAVMVGYWALEDRVTERNAERISEATIVKIQTEIDPISRTEYLEFRRRDSIERIHAELIALEYMNKSDSLLQVIASRPDKYLQLSKQIALLEAKIDAQKMPDDNDQLARIWEFLKSREKQDSTTLQLDQMMEEIRKLNAEKIRKIKSGDRAE